MVKKEFLIITEDDLKDKAKGFSFFNLVEAVSHEAALAPVVFYRGRLVKNRFGPIC